MPVEIQADRIHHVLAVTQEWDRAAAMDAESALQWMGWEADSEEPFLLRRYDVQIYLWYQLPTKFLAPLEKKRASVAALAAFLERLGGRAAEYAGLCRAPETDAMLVAWEGDDPDARRRLGELLDASGIEPPDTELLNWGSVMELEEARVREAVATELEEAIEAGRLTPRERGFRRRQVEVAEAALGRNGDGHGTRLEAVREERIARWLRSGFTRGSDERREIVERVEATVRTEPDRIDEGTAREATAPAQLLLERGEEGIALTQTGALNRALVREVVECRPDWWDAELFGAPNREWEIAPLEWLHGTLRRLRLLRRRGRRLYVTARGRELRQRPAALLEALSVDILAGETFREAIGELTAALLLDGAGADVGRLAARIHPATVAEGWQADGEIPDERDVGWEVGAFLHAAEGVGLLRGSSRGRLGGRTLTQAGRFGLHAGLRARALAPLRRL